MMSDYAALLPATWRAEVDRWLQEDLPAFDIGGFVVGGAFCSLAERVCATVDGYAAPNVVGWCG